jgi:pSer/pThr/pTyr-binding forkhead associated (FHA) protein
MSDVFLLILRLLFVVLLYLFLMQVVFTIRRDLRKPASIGTVTDKKSIPNAGRLIVIDSGPSSIAPGTIYELVPPRTTIGRGPANTIQIPDNFISAEHTRLLYDNRVWLVQDAGSQYGTYVNNLPAKQPLPCKPGDIIQVGPIRFQLKQ